MQLNDILVGDKYVLVKTNEGDFEFETNEYGMISVGDTVSDEIKDKLVNHDDVAVTVFPKTINFFVHDEGTTQDKSVVSDKLGLPEDHDIVEKISNIGYEIDLTINVENENGQFVAYITKIMGSELAEPEKVH